MAWAAQTGGGFIHSGSNLDVWTFGTRMASIGEVRFQLFDPSKLLAICVYGSAYMDTCFRVSLTGGTGGTIQLKKRTLGTLGAALTTVPNNPAHGLTTADAYSVSVRWVNGVISVYLNGAATPIFTYDTAGALGEFTGIGFESNVNGVQVGGVTMFALVRTFAQLADVAWWVAGGTLYASDSGRGGAKVIGQFFDPEQRIRGAEGKQHAYILDGSRIIDFDAATMTAALLSLDSGTMPGQTALNTPLGATTANAIAWNNDRLELADQNAKYASAIGFGTPTKSFDVAATDIGRAYVIPAKVGQPIIALFNAENNRAIFGSQRSTWSQIGDPAIGYPEVSRLHDLIGFTGPTSAVMAENGLLFLHTNEGACMIPSGGGIVHLSRDVLTDIIQQENAAETLVVSLCPDLKRHGIWVFLTPADGTSVGRHLFYDTRVGRFQPASDPLSGLGGGGWMPIDFASAALQPLCCMNYRGDVVFGTRDGRMVFFDAAAQDDCGTPFTSTLTLNMLRDQDMEMGTLLRDFSLAMGIGSADTTLEVYAGDTPERAFLDGYLLFRGSMTHARDSFGVSGSAAAMVLKMSSTGRFALESCQTDTQPTPLNPIDRRPALTPTAPCQPPLAAAAPPGDDTGGGPGPGGVDPPTCTACATWMAANFTNTIGGQQAYRLAGSNGAGNTLLGAQDEVAMNLPTLLAANICDIGSNPNLYVTSMDVALDPNPQIMSASAFAGLTVPPYSAYEKTWNVYFRCADQVA